MPQIQYKMPPQVFLNEVVQLYREARKPTFNTKRSTIRRGRSHSISSKAEDLFAYFLSRNLPTGYEFLTDQPVTIGGTTFYPDILPILNGRVNHILDLKTDLGWMRNDVGRFCRDKRDMIKKIQNKKGKIKDGITKEESHIIFFPKLKYHIVSISGENITKMQRESYTRLVNKFENIELYYLSSKIYPNNFEESKYLIRDIVNKGEFDRLIGGLV